MKRVLFFVALCCVMAFQPLSAQDIIVTKQSTRIDAKVLEISDTEVRYKKASNPDGPTFVMSTSEIVSILFANGEVQNIGKEQVQEGNGQVESVVEKYRSVTLLRWEGKIVSEEEPDIYSDERLHELLGDEEYNSYLSASKQYSTGYLLVTIGWVSNIVGIVGSFVLARAENISLSLLGSAGSIVLAGVGTVFLPVGYTIEGIAKGRISRIAEGYNASHQYRPEVSMSFSPALMDNLGQVAPGAGLTLRF